MLDDRKLSLIDLVRGTARSREVTEQLSSVHELREELGRPLRVAAARIDGIGDWLLTLPLVASLQASPDVDHVTLVSTHSYRNLLSHEGVSFAGVELWASHHTPWPHGTLGKILPISVLGQRRARRAGEEFNGRFDLIVIPRWDTDRGQNLRFFALGTGARIAGHDPALVPQASAKERREGAVLSIAARDLRENAHEQDRLEVLSDALGLDWATGRSQQRQLIGLDVDRSDVTDELVVLHTSAHDDFRRWSTEHWADLIRLLLDRMPGDIVLVGGPGDREGHRPLIEVNPARVRTVAGEVGLDALPALLDRAALFVGNDSGPAHFAGVVGVPTVVVSCFPEHDDPSHPNSPDRFAPRSAGGVAVVRPSTLGTPFASLSSAERKASIDQVTVDQVMAAIEGLEVASGE